MRADGVEMVPYLVTLGMDPETFARLDGLRRRYFPAERNLVPAHVSLFHHLPGVEGEAIAAALGEVAASTGPIPLRFGSLKKMGRGVMATVGAPELSRVHGELTRRFDRWLTPQDRQPYRPHVTIMNKAEPIEAARAFDELYIGWSPWDGVGVSLLLWEYHGGPWSEAAAYPFLGDSGRTV